jgi:L-aspartate oxidase
MHDYIVIGSGIAGLFTALLASRHGEVLLLTNMILIGRLTATAAIERRESRGGHYRRDFPAADPRWRRHIVLSKASAARCAKEVR